MPLKRGNWAGGRKITAPRPGQGCLPHPAVGVAGGHRVWHDIGTQSTETTGLNPMKKKVKVLVAQSCPTLCDSMDCSPPGTSVHGILQARILEWSAIPFSKGSSQPRDRTWVLGIAGRFTIWATKEDWRRKKGPNWEAPPLVRFKTHLCSHGSIPGAKDHLPTVPRRTTGLQLLV